MQRDSFAKWLVTVLGLTIAAVLAGGAWFYHFQEQDARRDAQTQLLQIAQNKADRIAQWRAEFQTDGEVTMADSLFVDGIARWMASRRPEDAEPILARFRALHDLDGYYELFLVAPNGQVLLSWNGNLDPLPADTAVQVSAAIDARQPMLTDLQTDSRDPAPHLSAVTPLFRGYGTRGEPLGAVVLVQGADHFLYPLLYEWPDPVRTAETLLVRRDGDSVLFLSDLRFQKGAALSLKRSLADTDLPAARALRGERGPALATDYRGAEVLWVGLPIPDSPWFLVAKEDAAEVYAGFRFQSALILSVVLLLIAASSAITGAIWQSHKNAYYRDLATARTALSASEERYRLTLSSVGDAVIATDAQGRITFLNSVAETLTGWPQSDAAGRPLEKVFHIVNEKTRTVVESPAERVLREGTIVGLANHTILIARNGTEYPIADSGAPIRAADGSLTGVVLVFRDQTEHRRAEEALASERNLLRTLIDHLPGTVYVKDTESRFLVANRAVTYSMRVASVDDLVGKSDADFFSPDQAAKLRALEEGVLRFGQPVVDREEHGLDAEGNSRSMLTTKLPLRDGGGKIVGLVGISHDITERKKAEETLASERNLLRTLIDHLPGSVYVKDTESRFLVANRAVALRLGMASSDDLLGKSDADLFPSELAASLRAEEAAVMQTGEPLVDKDENVTDAQGKTHWYVTTKLPLRDAQGAIVGLVGISHDLTERKGAEEALRESEGSYRSLFDNMQEGFAHCRMLFDEQGRPQDFVYLDVNESFGVLTGLKDVVGRLVSDVIPGIRELSPELFEAYGRVALTGRAERFDFDFKSLNQWLSISVYCPAKGHFVAVFDNITERKRTDAALRQSEERYRALIGTSLEGFWVSDMDGRLLEVNDAYCAMSGYARETVLSMKVTDIVTAASPAEIEKHMRQIEATGSDRFETQHRRADGSFFDVEASVVILKGQNRALSFFTDITARKQAEAALRRSEERYRALIGASINGFWVRDLEGRVLEVNDAYCAMSGRTRESLLSMNITDIVAQRTPESLRGHMQGIANAGSDRFEAKHRRADGSLFDVDASVVLLQDQHRALCFFADITERKRAEEEIRKKTALLEAQVNATIEGILVVDGNGNKVLQNQRCIDLWRIPPEIAANSHNQEQLDFVKNRAKDPEAFVEKVMWLSTHPAEISRDEVEFQDGTVLDRYSAPVVGKDGEYFGRIWTFRDITVRKQTEAALRRQSAVDAGLAELSAELLKPGESIDDVYPVVLRHVLSLTRSEHGYVASIDGGTGDMINHSLTDMMAGASLAAEPQAYIAFPRGADGRYGGLWGHSLNTRESFFTNAPAQHAAARGVPNGHIPVRNYLSVPVVVEGELLGQIAVANSPRDYTSEDLESVRRLSELYGMFLRDRRNKASLQLSEEQLRQAMKMEAVGRLAGGVAHDFNNMLQVILSNADMAREETPADSPIQECLSEILKSGQRSADLTRQLLAFARKQTIAPRLLDLNDVVAGMLKMLGRLIGEDIHLLWKPAASLGQVKMDPAQIDQILANLVVNARDAINGVGRVTIETANADLDASYCEAHPGFVPGSYVLLAVSDDGIGMDKETQARIFEPFFTTKELGKGTGLGLATVYGVVKQNDGFVNVYSEPGKGTTFRIYLPRHKFEAPAPGAENAPAPLQRGTETVMLVEDEQAVLRLGKRLLEHLGYTVLAADSPPKAIAMATEYAGAIHLLVTDVVMPEMSGRALWQRLAPSRPGLKCLFMSGYTANVIAHQGVLDEGVHFLEKPFSLEALATKVRETLEAE